MKESNEKIQVRYSDPKVLRYLNRNRNSIARRHYDLWRNEQDPPVPQRCDNKNCHFYSSPLFWNKKLLKLILDHINGVNSDNRIKNLRLLCPNCDAQNIETRGGANKGKARKYEGGFCKIEKNGRRNYVMPAETGEFHID